jgi:hypothetical protein
MHARTLLLVLLCGGCNIDLTGICLPPATCDPYGDRGSGDTGGGVPRLSFNVPPSDVAEGAAITPAVRVQVLDANGNLVPTATTITITFTISGNPGGGTLSGTTTMRAANGTATFANLNIDKRGEGYSLTATAAGYASAVSGNFNVTPDSTADP